MIAFALPFTPLRRQRNRKLLGFYDASVKNACELVGIFVAASEARALACFSLGCYTVAARVGLPLLPYFL
jgi:hypothetical protein